jgi:hypothetical protein
LAAKVARRLFLERLAVKEGADLPQPIKMAPMAEQILAAVAAVAVRSQVTYLAPAAPAAPVWSLSAG